jgi:hypothetical protein
LLLAAPRMRTLVLERAGSVCAYACRGRGADLEGVVHEWGGAARDVLALLRAHSIEALRAGSERAYAMLPADAEALARALASAGAPPACGMLALGKLLDPRAAARSLLAALAADARRSASYALAPDGTLYLAGARASRVLGHPELLAWLAGPRAPLAAALERELGLAFDPPLVEPFVWGLDSI